MNISMWMISFLVRVLFRKGAKQQHIAKNVTIRMRTFAPLHLCLSLCLFVCLFDIFRIFEIASTRSNTHQSHLAYRATHARFMILIKFELCWRIWMRMCVCVCVCACEFIVHTYTLYVHKHTHTHTCWNMRHSISTKMHETKNWYVRHEHRATEPQSTGSSHHTTHTHTHTHAVTINPRWFWGPTDARRRQHTLENTIEIHDLAVLEQWNAQMKFNKTRSVLECVTPTNNSTPIATPTYDEARQHNKLI